MTFAPRHLTDAELLALIDGEHAQQQHAFAHFAACAACRDRHDQLAATGVAFQHLDRTGLTLPPAETARLRLQQAMAAATPHSAPPSPPRWSYTAAALLLVAVGLGLYLHRTGATVQAAEVPNGRLTPGMTRAATLDQLCRAPDDDQDPTVTPEVQRAVLRAYGIDPARAADYQIDYLINPQLGGTNDARNLWPEPYRATAWNAEAKDALEAHLHQMVCNRQIDLAEAQRAIATDWIAAYKKYLDATPLQLSLKKD